MNVQRAIQVETQELTAEINTARGLSYFKPNGLTVQQIQRIRAMILKARELESAEQAVALRAVQMSEALRNNLRAQMTELKELMSLLNRQLRDLRLEEKREKRMVKEEKKEESAAAAFFASMPGR
ncbi:MAG: hypothetical protein QXH80_02965 [Candidatus Nanoarchaeia archaeon]